MFYKLKTIIMTFHSVWASSDNDLEIFFVYFRKDNGEHYNCLWGCYGSVIKNVNYYETLKNWETKMLMIVI